MPLPVMRPHLFLAALLLVACSPPAGDAPPADERSSAPTLSLELRSGGTDALLQAVSPVDDRVVWISGHRATWVRTTDGGASWTAGTMADADSLQFRDVAAFDASTAVLMSAGTGPLSRIFRTDDGGASWTGTFVMDEPEGFLDCMDFWDVERGLAYGDATGGELYLLRTDDGGRSWSRIDPAELPPALEGEGGFAASGTCLRTGGEGRAWIATGNAARSRLLTTEDYGASWTATDLPLVAGSARGATTVDIREDGAGWAIGGIIGGEGEGARVALTTDGGVTWTAADGPAFEGPAYGAAWVPGTDAVVAVGPGGLDVSFDAGRSWARVDTLTWWAVEFGPGGVGWASGPNGRIARLEVESGS